MSPRRPVDESMYTNAWPRIARVGDRWRVVKISIGWAAGPTSPNVHAEPHRKWALFDTWAAAFEYALRRARQR